jgi:hypothetical protein
MEGRPRLRYRKKCLAGDSFCAVADSSGVGILLMQKTGAHVRSWRAPCKGGAFQWVSAWQSKPIILAVGNPGSRRWFIRDRGLSGGERWRLSRDHYLDSKSTFRNRDKELLLKPE